MKDLVPYDIRLKGLKDGVHTFDFTVGSDFLPFFENAPDDVVTGSVRVLLEKRVGLIIMQFNLNAELHAPCDRCLADIKIPLHPIFY